MKRLIFIILLFASPCLGDVHFVSQTGNDSYNGDSPAQGRASFDTTFADETTRGDTIVVIGTVSDEFNITEITDSGDDGSSANDILYVMSNNVYTNGWTSRRPDTSTVWDGIIAGESTDAAVHFETATPADAGRNVQYITFIGISFNTSATNAVNVIECTNNVQNIIFEHCRFHSPYVGLTNQQLLLHTVTDGSSNQSVTYRNCLIVQTSPARDYCINMNNDVDLTWDNVTAKGDFDTGLLFVASAYVGELVVRNSILQNMTNTSGAHIILCDAQSDAMSDVSIDYNIHYNDNTLTNEWEWGNVDISTWSVYVDSVNNKDATNESNSSHTDPILIYDAEIPDDSNNSPCVNADSRGNDIGYYDIADLLIQQILIIP
jgi:hypothetical protein